MQRRERREVARAGVQAQKVEPDPLERGDALGEVRRRRLAPRRQHFGVGRRRTARARRACRSPRAPRRPAPRAPRRSPAARRAARGTPSAAPRTAPTRRRRAPLRSRGTRRAHRAASAPARRAGARAIRPRGCSRGDRGSPSATSSRILVGNELHVERVAHRPEQHRREHGREDPARCWSGSRGSRPEQQPDA